MNTSMMELSWFERSGDTDTAFLDEVRDKKAKMDKGLHIGSWGQLQGKKLVAIRKSIAD